MKESRPLAASWGLWRLGVCQLCFHPYSTSLKTWLFDTVSATATDYAFN